MSLFTRAFNKVGGYDRLATSFPGGPEPPGLRWERQCVQFGRGVRYDWCVTIVVTQTGVWLQARPPAQGVQAAIFLPWRAFSAARPVRLYWRSAVQLTCGAPAVGEITVFQPVWDAAAPYWSAAREYGG